jgi:hypothetical protein
MAAGPLTHSGALSVRFELINAALGLSVSTTVRLRSRYARIRAFHTGLMTSLASHGVVIGIKHSVVLRLYGQAFSFASTYLIPNVYAPSADLAE